MVAEIEGPKFVVDELSCQGPAVVAGGADEGPRGAAVRFDVIDVVAEASQADEVVQGLPDDAGDGDRAHHTE